MSDTPRVDRLEIIMDQRDTAPRDKLSQYADLCRELERELEQIKRNEYICPKCLLRQDDTHPKGDF